MTGRMFTAAWLVFVWLALTADASARGVLTAAALALALVTFFRPTSPARRRGRLRPLHAVSFAMYFLVKFVHANLQVARAVLQPGRVRHRRAIVAVRIAAPSETTTTLLAMGVSLTPGTFILELQREPAVMFVHILQFEGVRTARLDILELERRIVKAFGPPGATRRVAALMDEAREDAGKLGPEGETEE